MAGDTGGDVVDKIKWKKDMLDIAESNVPVQIGTDNFGGHVLRYAIAIRTTEPLDHDEVVRRVRRMRNTLWTKKDSQQHTLAWQAPPPTHNEKALEVWLTSFMETTDLDRQSILSPCCGLRTLSVPVRIHCGMGLCAARVPGKPLEHCKHCLDHKACNKELSLHSVPERAPSYAPPK